MPPTAHTCALPTAQIREAALTHRQMRASLSPAAAAIQPWMGGGKSARKPPRPRRTTPSIMPKQPGSASLSDSSFSSRPELSGQVAGRVCPGNRPGALAVGDCRVRAEPVESPLRNIHPVFGRLRHHGRLLQEDTRRSTSRRDAGGQTGGHTDARGCQGPRRGGGCVGATDHPRERAQMVCPGSAPSQPRIGSPTHSEALQLHRRRRARAQSAALLLVALARWLMNTIEAAPLAPRGRPETTPRPRTASASRRAATESAHGRPEQSRCLARLALGATTSPSRRCRGPPWTLGIY